MKHKKVIAKLVPIFMSLIFTGCTTLLSTSTTDIFPENKSIITASETGYGIFHLTTPDFNIQPKLRTQCPNGIVNGVQTTLSVREFIVVQVYQVKTSAYCK